MTKKLEDYKKTVKQILADHDESGGGVDLKAVQTILDGYGITSLGIFQ